MYDDTNRGAIWKNENKATDNHPDFKGNLNVNGQDFWVSAWKRRPDDNPKSPALRFSIQPKTPAAVPQEKPKLPQKTEQPDFEDDIPF